MLTVDQFDALNALRTAGFTNQRKFAKSLGVSLGKANALLSQFAASGWIRKDHSLTRLGFSQLKPHKVDNAIIMAAGLSSRFAPLSYEKPKGLLKVKGEVLVERQIRQLQEVGIKDITVVVGYMKEKFRYLVDKFGVTIVENDDYHRYNNTSTLIRVLRKLKNTYICSSDNYFVRNVFEPYVYQAYYAATFFPGPANEWGVKSDKKGLITGISHYPIGMWCMMGHVYFDRAFSADFKFILKEEYKKDTTKKELWEAVYERNVKRLKMHVRKYEDGIIYEFDSLDDLRRFDGSFFENCGSRIIRRICGILGCKESEVVGIKVVSGDVDDLAFAFLCRKKSYVYHNATKTVEEMKT